MKLRKTCKAGGLLAGLLLLLVMVMVLPASAAERTASEGSLTVQNLTANERANSYALSGRLYNSYPEERSAMLLAAGYDQAGRLTDARIFPAAAAEAGGYAKLEASYVPSDQACRFRVFALEQGAWSPLSESYEIPWMYSGLGVYPRTLENMRQGTTYPLSKFSIGAWYGSRSKTVSADECTVTSSDERVASVRDGEIVFHGGGSAELTFSCTLGGITRTDTVQVSAYGVKLIKLDAFPNPVSGTEGDFMWLNVTATYADQQTRRLEASEYTVTSSNSAVAAAGYGRIDFKSPGTAVLTVSFTEGGITKIVTVDVTVHQVGAALRLANFLQNKPDKQIKLSSMLPSGAASTVIAYDAGTNRIRFQFSLVTASSGGGGGYGGFTINPDNGSIDNPIAAVMSSGGSTSWRGTASPFTPSTYHHSSTRLNFTTDTGYSSLNIQDFANDMIGNLFKYTPDLLAQEGTGVTLGQLGFNLYP